MLLATYEFFGYLLFVVAFLQKLDICLSFRSSGLAQNARNVLNHKMQGGFDDRYENLSISSIMYMILLMLINLLVILRDYYRTLRRTQLVAIPNTTACVSC